jgi:hypothetical protein
MYEEWLNPGLNQDHRCMAIKTWEREHDDFLRRAEAFGLDEKTAAALWRKQMGRLVFLERQCARFTPDERACAPECALQRDGLCLAALPKCEGKCRYFKPAESKGKS